MTDETRQSLAETVARAAASIPDRFYWLIGKGRLQSSEPLYGAQIIDPESGITIADGEGDEIAEAVAAALKQLTNGQQSEGER